MNYGEVDAKRRRKIAGERTPPILLRRRLSAPETIMRKHLLAQQRSSSQDSQKSSDSDTNASCASDSNLNKRRHPDIRRSTLMKRFWESSKGNLNVPSFPSSYAEWQHGSYRSKAGSTKSLLNDSPKHVRNLPRRLLLPESPSDTSFATNVPKSEEDSYVVYSSRTDATDSYPLSTRSESVNNNDDNPTSSSNMAPTPKRIVQATKAYRINNNGINDVTNTADIPNLPIKYQLTIGDNEKHVVSNENQREVGKTNLNVITNVQLSQSTLNTIFNQVMQDVLHSPPPNPELVDENIVKQKAYNFKLNLDPNENADSDQTKTNIEQKCISEINVGSPYKSPSPAVPRLSALPRTSSMEVNISSNDSLDKDSDTSLVDSLDDPSSPRVKIKRHTNINITKINDSEVLGDGEEIIEQEETKKTIKKSSVFYIPIDNTDKSESDSPHVVSNLLPSKLKEKLLQRQMKREEKRLQERMKAFDIENGNASAYFSTSPETPLPSKKNTTRTSKKAKTTLPQIDLYRDFNKSLRANYTQRSLNRYRESVETTTNSRKSFMLPKSHTKQNTLQNQGKQKQKTKSSSTKESAKHIEILEIMEIVEPERAMHLTPKSKSRIPIFQHASGTKLPKLRPKPTFLDFGEVGQPGDPKLDQLIANILIDTLNHEDIKDLKDRPRKSNVETEKIQAATASKEQSNNNSGLIEQAAEILTKQVLGNNNLDSPQLTEQVGHPQEAENIPQGWITFYMLQKTQSPDSTSDEGVKTANTATKGTQYSTCDADSKTPRKYRLRRKTQQDGWSVTFSNNHDDEVEMKFKFPSLSSKRQTSKKSGEKCKNPGLNFEDVCDNNLQSEIYKSKQYLKNPANVKNRRRQICLSPRATKTSRQRTMLHRQHHVHNSCTEADNISHILSISGSGFNQIRRLPHSHMNDLLLKKLFAKWRGQQGVDANNETEVNVAQH